MSSKALREGTHVTVRALRKRGIITGCLAGGVYVVAVGSFTVNLKGEELDVCDSSSEVQSEKNRCGKTNSKMRVKNRVRTLDLHGFTVDEATRALEAWLNQAILDGCSQLQVIHGLGSGKVQKAVQATLAHYSAVRAYRVNDWNPGATDIFIS